MKETNSEIDNSIFNIFVPLGLKLTQISEGCTKVWTLPNYIGTTEVILAYSPDGLVATCWVLINLDYTWIGQLNY